MRNRDARPLRVLAVEDDEELGAFYRTALSEEGHQVDVARNGKEALERLAWQPDVILLDLMMPVMDGYEFIHRLRAEHAGRRIPVLVLSAALPPGHDVIRGVEAVIRKPFEVDRLLRVIDMYARRPRQPLN